MPLPDAFTQALAERFGKRFSTAEAVRAHHGHDESHFPDALPDGVVWPHSTAEVVEVVKLCHAHRVPVIPFGVGSSLEGHILATNGGISIDLSEMNQIVTIHDEDMDAVVQPGVTRKALNAALHAAYLAAGEAADGQPSAIDRRHVAHAVWRELAKEGREVAPQELGELLADLPREVRDED